MARVRRSNSTKNSGATLCFEATIWTVADAWYDPKSIKIGYEIRLLDEIIIERENSRTAP